MHQVVATNPSRSHGASRAMAALTALVMIVAACGQTQLSSSTIQPSEAAGTAQPTGPEPAARQIEKARLTVSSKVDTLDPKVAVTVAPRQVIGLTAGLLYRFDSDRRPVPELAENAVTSADGRTVTVSLKPNIVYSDGTPVRADDVVFAYSRQVDGGVRAVNLRQIDRVTAPDDQTVVFSMSAPYPELLNALAFPTIMPLHPRAKVEADVDYFEHPVSAGPYLVTEWVPGASTMLLDENPKYYRAPMAIKQIEFAEVADFTSRVLQLASGETDWAYDLPIAARSSIPADVQQYISPIGGVFHLYFNLTQTGPLSDPKVRQAISLAIDRDGINEKAFFGAAPPVKSWLYNCGSLCDATVLPNDGRRDVEAAKALLGGTPSSAGVEFSIQVSATRPGWKEAALVIAENLKDVGMTVKVEPIEEAAISANSSSGSYQAIFSGLGGDPQQMLEHYFTPGGVIATWTRYSNPSVAALVAEAGSEVDEAKRRVLYEELQRLAYPDMIAVPIAERAVLVGSRLPNDAVVVVKNDSIIIVKTLEEFGS